ncbi:MAG TPA: hypothetical protein VGO09_02075 [Flavisolibacter sp.]|jgi:hypothetical protein|nr:hypothetical protein [Flavisolibacter sp.]
MSNIDKRTRSHREDKQLKGAVIFFVVLAVVFAFLIVVGILN